MNAGPGEERSVKLRYLTVAALVGALSVVLATAAIGAKKSPPPKPKTFFAVMLGKNEVSPTTGKKGAGDRNGRGGATAVIDGNKFCFGIVVRNLGQPIAAHVHKGRPGVNGPIRIPLTAPSSGDPGASSGCVTVSDSALLAAIQRNPSKYFFNVHTTAFPNGAIRGQIFGERK
jgi:CHRD domain